MFIRIQPAWKTVFRLAFSALAVIFISYQLDFKALYHYVAQINISYYLLAIVLQIVSGLVAAYKWGKIMDRIGYQSHYNFYAKAYLVSSMFNQVLPTSVGGDAVRVAYAHKLGGDLRKGFYGVFADRYYGIIGLLILNASTLFWLHDKIPSSVYTVVCLVTFTIGSSLLAALIPSQLHFLKEIKFIRGIYQLSHVLINSMGSLRQSLILLLLAILSNFLTIYAAYLIALSLNLPIQLLDLLGIMPVITLITLLPISFAGWGLREGAMVGFLLFLDLPKAAILALSLLYGVMLILASLPGLYIYLFHRVEPATQ